MKSLRPAPELIEASSFPGVYSSFLWKNLAITVWFGPPSMASLDRFEHRCKTFCAKHPEGVSSVHIMVPGGSSMPTAEARAQLTRILRENAKHAAAGAAVIPGTGFWASALRSMVTAVLLIVPRSVALQIFGDIEPLADWLAPLHSERTGVMVQASDILRVLRSVQHSISRAAA